VLVCRHRRGRWVCRRVGSPASEEEEAGSTGASLFSFLGALLLEPRHDGESPRSVGASPPRCLPRLTVLIEARRACWGAYHAHGVPTGVLPVLAELLHSSFSCAPTTCSTKFLRGVNLPSLRKGDSMQSQLGRDENENDNLRFSEIVFEFFLIFMPKRK
jgi:hypothetical protein